jgi:hypothetical protein
VAKVDPIVAAIDRALQNDGVVFNGGHTVLSGDDRLALLKVKELVSSAEWAGELSLSDWHANHLVAALVDARAWRGADIGSIKRMIADGENLHAALDAAAKFADALGGVDPREAFAPARKAADLLIKKGRRFPLPRQRDRRSVLGFAAWTISHTVRISTGRPHDDFVIALVEAVLDQKMTRDDLMRATGRRKRAADRKPLKHT